MKVKNILWFNYRIFQWSVLFEAVKVVINLLKTKTKKTDTNIQNFSSENVLIYLQPTFASMYVDNNFKGYINQIFLIFVISSYIKTAHIRIYKRGRTHALTHKIMWACPLLQMFNMCDPRWHAKTDSCNDNPGDFIVRT
jgi:hypothetical protein